MKVERVLDGMKDLAAEDWTITLKRHELEQLHLVLLANRKMAELSRALTRAITGRKD